MKKWYQWFYLSLAFTVGGILNYLDGRQIIAAIIQGSITVALGFIQFFCDQKRRKGQVQIVLDYTPMWETMRKKDISQYSLLKAGVDHKTLDALKKRKNITLLTLEKICTILSCTPNEVVRFLPDE